MRRPARLPVSLACLLALSLGTAFAQAPCELPAADQPRPVTSDGSAVTFREAIALATSASGVAAALTQLELACLSLSAATYPVSASASGGVNASTDFSGDGGSTGLELSVNASLRPGWGATAEAAAAAERAAHAAADAVRVARSEAVRQAVRLYGDVLAAAHTLDVAKLQAELAELQAEAVRARLAAGAVLPADVTLAELAARSAGLDLAAAEVVLASALTQLSLHLGVHVTAVASEFEGGARPDVNAAGATWLAARADVRAGERDLAAAADALVQAHRASGVNFSGSASLGVSEGSSAVSLGASMDTRDLTPALSGRFSTSSGGAPGGSGAAWRGSLSVSATVPLGPPDTRVRAAEVTYRQAEERLALLRSSAEAQVAALSAQVAAADERVRVAGTRAELARQAEADARARLDLGLVGPQEVMQSAIARLQAAGQLRSARLDRLADLMALADALGGAPTEVLW